MSQGFAGEFVYIQIFQNEDGEEGKRRKDEKTKRDEILRGYIQFIPQIRAFIRACATPVKPG